MIYLFGFLTSFLLYFHLPEKPEMMNMEQLQVRTIKPENDTLYVVNFWATWCRPCINEMPFFINAEKKFSGSNIKLLLVSVDFMTEKQRVEKFINEKNIGNEVILLNAGNPNKWINIVDSTWSGAIPATVFYKQGKKVYFHEGEFTQTALDSIIKTKIK
jgi:thiol-disulfide isomerase/thioredoxin